MGEARLWTGGRVFTGRRYVEAILVEEGRVSAVGSAADVRQARPEGAERTDLDGGLVIPGLVDAHLHVSDLTRFREGLDLTGARNLPEVLKKVRRWGEAHSTGPVVGRGLDVDRSLAGRWPTRRELDEVLSGRPVLLVHTSGHAGVANRRMLESAHLDGPSPEELAGRVGTDPDGTPNGIVFEEALRWLTSSSGEPVDPDAVVRTLEFLSSFGITSVGTMNLAPEEAPMFRDLAGSRRLPVRVRAYVRLARFRDLPTSELNRTDAPELFGVVGTKSFVDGAFGPRTAWLSEPYRDAEGSGVAVTSDEELTDDLAASEALGLAPAIHAIGDRAVERAARLLRPYADREGARPRVEHAALTPPTTFPALSAARAALVVQPGFVWSDWWLTERLGPERARWAYAFRSLADSGHLLVGSSDAPYDPPDPWRGLRATSERVDGFGRSANPDPTERLDFEAAFRLYGVNAGTALGEPLLGSLEPGAPADLVRLSARSLAAAVRAGAPTVRETWLAGVRVFDAGAVARAASG